MREALSLSTRHLEDHLFALIVFVVSQDNSCRYCIASAHSVMRAMGFREKEIQELSTKLHTPSLSQRERKAIDLARRLSRANPRPTHTDLRELRDAGFSPEAITELGAVATTTLVSNRIGVIRDLDPPDVPTVLRGSYGMLIRLWRHILMLGKDWPWNPEPYRRGEYDGPGGELLDSLPPVPGLKQLREILERVWESSSIPLRTRAMMLGVVGRLVDCSRSWTITRRTLEREGFSPEGIRTLLERLDSPELTEIERRLLSISRASVWMQEPEPVVRQFRELEEEFGPEVADEALAFLAVANGMCRFTVLEGLNGIDAG